MRTLSTGHSEGNNDKTSLVMFWDKERVDHGLQSNTFEFESIVMGNVLWSTTIFCHGLFSTKVMIQKK